MTSQRKKHSKRKKNLHRNQNEEPEEVSRGEEKNVSETQPATRQTKQHDERNEILNSNSNFY